MTKDELLQQAIVSFKAIEQRAARLTTGNAAHSRAAIAGTAKRAVEFIEKHINDKTN